MRILVRMTAILIVAVVSVVLAQRLARRVYAGIGKKYIQIEGGQGV